MTPAEREAWLSGFLAAYHLFKGDAKDWDRLLKEYCAARNPS